MNLIDRNCDATILAGASDRRLASKVLDYARSTRERLNIRPSDFDLGSLLHHDIPFMAMVAGSTLREGEKTGNPHLSEQYTRERSVAEAARHVMRSTAYSTGMPDNCLLADPIRGNAAALLVDRVARMAGVTRSDEDGPRDMLSAHISSSSARLSKPLTTEWSPGWPDAVTDSDADVRQYSRRMFALDDRQIASEMLAQARDIRTRLGVEDGSSPHAVALWQTIPSMASLFGARLESGEGRGFQRAAHGMNDQQAFEMASGLVADVVGDDTVFRGRSATIGDRALFAPVALGNTMGILLDRSARTLDAERGGIGDPMGMAVAEMRRDRGLPPGFSWQPDDRARTAAAMAAARAHPGMGS